MEKKSFEAVCLISRLVLLMSSIIFLCVAALDKKKDSPALTCALGCTLLSAVIGLVRVVFIRIKEKIGLSD